VPYSVFEFGASTVGTFSPGLDYTPLVVARLAWKRAHQHRTMHKPDRSSDLSIIVYLKGYLFDFLLRITKHPMRFLVPNATPMSDLVVLAVAIVPTFLFAHELLLLLHLRMKKLRFEFNFI
jgi:hypothetical protein